MDIKQCKEIYESLKKGKDFIANIDKDFFLNFAELLFNELEKKDTIINNLFDELHDLAVAINEEYHVEEFLLNKETIKEYYSKRKEEQI